ncbi:MAG TPA: thioesterase family protein [Casimicrobiaceae bacterium]|nr:thioesterase family protein [Casimicrobiaceae bacterium]
MSKSHLSHFSVEFGDCDPAQIVFYPNFFRWMDAATLRFFRACGVPSWKEMEASTGIIGAPLVDASARFIRPASYGDMIDVETTVVVLLGKSFVMRHLIRREGELLVEGREVRVFARRHPDDPRRIQAMPMPDNIRKLCDLPPALGQKEDIASEPAK